MIESSKFNVGDKLFLPADVSNGRCGYAYQVEIMFLSHDGKLALVRDFEAFPSERIVETRFLFTDEPDYKSAREVSLGDLVIHAASGKQSSAGIVTKVNDSTVNILMQDGTVRRGNIQNIMVVVKVQKENPS